VPLGFESDGGLELPEGSLLKALIMIAPRSALDGPLAEFKVGGIFCRLRMGMVCTCVPSVVVM